MYSMKYSTVESQWSKNRSRAGTLSSQRVSTWRRKKLNINTTYYNLGVLNKI